MKLGAHELSLSGLFWAAAPPILVGAAFVYVRLKYPAFVTEWKEFLSFLGTLLGAISAIPLAIVIAAFSAEATTRNSKVQTAWEALSKKQWDKDYLKARETYLKLVARNAALSKYAHKPVDLSDDFIAEFEAVMNIANDYEIMAVGIKRHVLDEGVIRDAFRTAWIEDYKALSPFFDAVREESKNDRYFKEFKAIAKRWKDEAKNGKGD